MRKCWQKRAAVVTALPKNDLGWLVEDFIMQGGVDMSHVIWRDFDGLGRNTRVGLNFTEKGFGIRPALGCSDRGHSAASQIKPGEVNWEKLFGEEGVRWFHTGGIFAALAPNTSEAVLEAVEVAKKYGTVVAYDLNYRASLWKSQGGKEGAQRINRNIAKYVDVMIGNEEDFTACLGFEVEGADEHLTNIETESFKKMIQTAVADLPELQGRRDDAAQGDDGERQRLVGAAVLRGTALPVDAAPEPRDLRPRRRRRRLRVRSRLRLPRREGPAGRRGVRRRTRRARDDDARRHEHGARRGSRGGDEGEGGAGDSVSARGVSRCRF